ncbi:hypothetical protein ANCCEY_03609 [Ancylostoma ceylanicum]|uniref:Tetratricopeptide repeat protein n=1 Tax=Ancylostoma ceylanicum TaxID=53326 RepID=A0A0D6MB10_9BILA|nr:hypothetical protein ANCCEY_03609 [Ancylostoma ceylanicum]
MSFISLMYDWRSQIHTMMVQRFHDWERSGALLITEAVRIEDFSRDQCCRLFYQKGAILSQLERNDDAMHAFSAAAAMIDPTNAPPMNTACNMFKTWAHHLDNLFHNEV